MSTSLRSQRIWGVGMPVTGQLMATVWFTTTFGFVFTPPRLIRGGTVDGRKSRDKTYVVVLVIINTSMPIHE